MDTTYQGNIVQSPAAWSAVVSMALCMTSPGASSERPRPSAGEHGSPGPLDLSIGDFPTNEKIVYLARRLTENASVPFGNEQPGDLCYWTPRGNPALFYDTYRYSPGLIRPVGSTASSRSRCAAIFRCASKPFDN